MPSPSARRGPGPSTTRYVSGMSIEVTPHELAEAVALYGPTAYVLTGGADGRPRITHSSVVVAGGRVRAKLGRTASADAAARPAVAVLWPANAAQSMSLIADGIAHLDGEPGPDTMVEIEVTSAVRHRAAPPLGA